MSDLSKRIEKLEEKESAGNIIMIASQHPDGSFSWNDHTFPDEQSFDAAVRAARVSGTMIILDEYF